MKTNRIEKVQVSFEKLQEMATEIKTKVKIFKNEPYYSNDNGKNGYIIQDVEGKVYLITLTRQDGSIKSWWAKEPKSEKFTQEENERFKMEQLGRALGNI
jgi:hypothetical protein